MYLRVPHPLHPLDCATGGYGCEVLSVLARQGTEEDLARMNALLAMLSSRARLLDRERFAALRRNSLVFCIRHASGGGTVSPEAPIVATATLAVVMTPIWVKGIVEDVVVDTAHRGAGLGRAIMQEMITVARDAGLMCLELTSSPVREAANALYASMGFSLRQTNAYRLDLA